MKRTAFFFLFLFSSIYSVIAQEVDTTAESSEWGFSFAANFYLLQGNEVYVNPVFTAERKHLFLQARYNYEDFQTGSVFGGYNFSVGEKVEFSATPIVGAVFGNTNGIAPGLLWELSWWKLNLYTESEYLFDFSSKENNFYYAWAELTIAPADWMWLGITVQRTRLYETDLDVQRGITIGFTEKILSVGAYVFNLGWDDPFGVVSVEVEF